MIRSIQKVMVIIVMIVKMNLLTKFQNKMIPLTKNQTQILKNIKLLINFRMREINQIK
jgi:hypothetical protein